MRTFILVNPAAEEIIPALLTACRCCMDGMRRGVPPSLSCRGQHAPVLLNNAAHRKKRRKKPMSNEIGGVIYKIAPAGFLYHIYQKQAQIWASGGGG